MLLWGWVYVGGLRQMKLQHQATLLVESGKFWIPMGVGVALGFESKV